MAIESSYRASREWNPMISPVSGEVVFSDGLQFSPHASLTASHIRDARSHRLLPIPGWTQHRLGVHPSEHGSFEVEAVSDRDSRIQVVLVSHAHSFYQPNTPNDSERRAFHESILGSDLLGQREYSWGEAFCRLDTERTMDWLVIVYTVGPQIPLQRAELLLHLYEHEPVSSSRNA
jgi:hypothetical protein